MKKIVFSCSVVLVGVALTGCGSQSHKTNIHAKIKSEKVSSSKKNSSSAKSSSSSMKSSSSLTSSITQSIPATNVNTQNQQQKQNNDIQPQATQQSQQAITPQQPVQQNQNASTNNLQDFVAKYSMSPAAYKMEHDGMTAQQALEATPDNMKTTGELQTQHNMEQGIE